DVAELPGGVERDSVDTLKPINAADRFAGVCVHNFNAGSVGDIKTMRAGICSQVVPAALAANRPSTLNAERLLCDGGHRCQKDRGERGSEQQSSEILNDMTNLFRRHKCSGRGSADSFAGIPTISDLP